jgi:hypothetical protein
MVGPYAGGEYDGPWTNTAAFDFVHFEPDSVECEDGGEAALRLSASPRRDTVKVGKLARFTANLRNTGDGDAANVRVCVRAPKARVRVMGKACVARGGLAAGESMAPRFALKPKRSARGKRVNVTFTATAAGLVPLRAQATLKVRRR